MSRSSSGKQRPASANSRNAWHDDGLDAPGGRPDSRQSSRNGEFENRDLSLRDEPDLMPSAMEGEMYIDGEIHIAGQEKPRGRPQPITGFAKFKKGLRGMWSSLFAKCHR